MLETSILQPQVTATGPQVHLVNIDQIPGIVARLVKKPVPMALDLETTGLNPRQGYIIALQFGTSRNVFILDTRSYYLLSESEQAEYRRVLAGLCKACPLWIGHNLKFDCTFLLHQFGLLPETVADTMLQEQVIQGTGLSRSQDNYGVRVDLASTAMRYGLEVSKFERHWFINLDTRPEWSMPFPEQQIAYMAQDVVIPLAIYQAQRNLLQQLALTEIADLENVCLPAVAAMEVAGCYVDQVLWLDMIERRKAERDALEAEISEVLTPVLNAHRRKTYENDQAVLDTWQGELDQVTEAIKAEYQALPMLSGVQWGTFKKGKLSQWRATHPRPKASKLDESPINLGSHDQLGTALHLVGIHVSNTARGTLEMLAGSHPLVPKIMAWKKAEKYIDAFGETILARIDQDGRIHPVYNQIGADTGRMSCSSPNWQQLPGHEEESYAVRRCVIAMPGHCLLTADFSNIELRILAEMSNDATMLRFFEEGKDLHSATASLMFHLPPDVDPKKVELRPGLNYRFIAKSINFGLAYGMGPSRLAATLRISKEEATGLIQAYKETYPQAVKWLELSSLKAINLGYSSTIGGRKRFYPQIAPPEYGTYLDPEMYASRMRDYKATMGSYQRQAKNAPIQGSNADITKYALALLYKHLPGSSKIVACVHDEIVLEVPIDQATAVSETLSKAMHKACRKYLKKVAIPPVEVMAASYWRKE